MQMLWPHLTEEISGFLGKHSKGMKTSKFMVSFADFFLFQSIDCPWLLVYFARFLKSGVYLVLEKLELQVYQRLVKKMWVQSSSGRCQLVILHFPWWPIPFLICDAFYSHIIQRQKEPAKAHQIKLEVVVKALKWLEIDMDVDEVLFDSTHISFSNWNLQLLCDILTLSSPCYQVECIMACLIYKNLIKGYFAHKSKVLVLSKQDPFPKLNGKPV